MLMKLSQCVMTSATISLSGMMCREWDQIIISRDKDLDIVAGTALVIMDGLLVVTISSHQPRQATDDTILTVNNPPTTT